MRLFHVISLIICGTLATKETPEDYAKLLSNKLLLEIEKRLNDDSIDLSGNNNADQCTYALNTSTIIRTSVSTSAGAKFLTVADVSTRDECISQCCGDDSCDLIVFKEQEDHACYLFHCGKPSKCQFTSHKGFSSVFIRHNQAPPPPISHTSGHTQHEQELKNLASEKAQKTEANGNPVIGVAATTLAPPHSVSTQHPAVKVTTEQIQVTNTAAPHTTVSQKNSPKTNTGHVQKVAAPLFGTCAENGDCAGSVTMCLAGYCVCKDGYHEQEGVCRKDCSHVLQFECENKKQPLVFPQCIAIYDRCDGIPQCKDESDEKNCDQEPPTDHNVGKVDQDNKNVKLPPTKHIKTPVHHGHEASMTKPLSHGSSSTHQETANQEASATDSANQSKDTTHIDNTDSSKSDEKGSDADSNEDTDKSKNVADSSKESGLSAGKDASKVPKVPPNEESSKNQSQPVLQAAARGDIDQIYDEEAGEGSSFNVPSNQGAIVALALGLAITAVMLFWVGCRLRTVKKRLRRGRALNSNEADYLINGMYL